MSLKRFLAVVTLLSCVIPQAAAAARSTYSLAGEWQFAFDPRDEGVASRWFERELGDTIRLPGTTETREKGRLNEAADPLRLTRLRPYAGAAWYARTVRVPAEWKGKHLTLRLERTKPSRLWLDGRALGDRDSLVAPHEYTLGPLAPGEHRLCLRVDNARLPPLGDPHQWSDHTQTNWNGIVGELAIVVRDPVRIEQVEVYPSLETRSIRVRVEIANASGAPAGGTLELLATLAAGGRRPGPLRLPFEVQGTSEVVVEGTIVLGSRAALWDEFQPARHTVRARMEARAAGRTHRDALETTFGLREFRTQGTQFAINGRPTFLRGRHDGCVFPLTGHPPMDVAGWLRVFETSKRWGLNHHRFHSWCPPAAAFEAADRLGVYLQPELPNWAAFGPKEHDDYLRAEGQRLLRAFGNHPSFVMLSLGNELGGSQETMAPFVELFRRLDPRHLYAQGTNNWFPEAHPGDDYWASFQVRGKKIRGSFATVDLPLGHVQTGPASTLEDYAAEIAGVRVPVVSHEIGEYQSAPDFREIAKYTGVVRARNLEPAGLLEQAEDFARASGRLAALCYREEVEAALRTPGFGGFQLLDLQDFPGQGTALVGLLDAFLDEKGHVLPERWREACSPTVPLLRMARYTWTTGELFEAKAEVAHYGAADLRAATGVWTIRDGAGAALASGHLAPVDVAVGSVGSLGAIRWPLAGVVAPAKLSVELALEAGAQRLRNSWDLWVYPETVDTAPGEVLVARKLDSAAQARLAAGGRVLLIPEPGMPTRAVAGAFAPDFWNFGMFRRFSEQRVAAVAPGTLGILVGAGHPALAAFPTEFHANWQWLELLRQSRPIVLDELPRGYRPIVQGIDNYERAYRLGLVFELAVGKGRLLVCSIDLPSLSARPEARQLLHSLLAYAASPSFEPATPVDGPTLRRLLE